MTIDGLTRAQRQAHTRSRLIATARDLFLNEGYAVTTLDRVAAVAGYSKGAVYSNFAGKEELCLAVLDDIHAEQIEDVVGAFTLDADLDARIDVFAAWAQVALGEPRVTALEVEFAAAARSSAFVAQELRRRHAEILEALAGLIRQVTGEAGVELPQPAEDAALALLSLGIGLGAMRSLNPELKVEVFADTMRALLRAAD